MNSLPHPPPHASTPAPSVHWGGWRTILLSLLLLAMMPAGLIGLIAYRQATHRLESEISRTLRMVAAVNSRALQTYFETLLNDVEQLGRQPATALFLTALERRSSASGSPSAEGGADSPWALAVAQDGSGVRWPAVPPPCDDLLFADHRAEVLFPAAGKATPPGPASVAGTILTAAIQATLATGGTVFTGFSADPSPGAPSIAFVTTPIDTDGTLPPAGVLACKISSAAIDRKLFTATDTDGLRIRLVDANGSWVAGTTGSDADSTRLGALVSPTQPWPPGRPTGASEPFATAPITYTDAGGQSWIGLQTVIQAGRHPLQLVVELNRNDAFSDIDRLGPIMLAILVLTGIGIALTGRFLWHRIVQPVRHIRSRMAALTETIPRLSLRHHTGSEFNRLAIAFDALIQHIHKLQALNDNRAKLLSGLARLHRLIGGEPGLKPLCRPALEFLWEFLGLQRAEFYVASDDGDFQRTCRLPEPPGTTPGGPPAGASEGALKRTVPAGEGHVGQAALEKAIITCQTGAVSPLLNVVPKTNLANLVAVPLMTHNRVKGVLELEKATVFSRFEGRFVEAAAEVIAVALDAALIQEQEAFLRQSIREQANTLKVREAALETSSRELKAQKKAFQKTEHDLHLKQLELEAANAQMIKYAADLEAHMATLEAQTQDMQRQNAELEKAHHQLAEKAHQLELSSRYKTEFMANMSHELRTPLNSVLLLSRLLLEDRDRTLTDRQAEFARTIHAAGEDLLNLINEILDLAKVESGKMEIDRKPVVLRDLARTMQESFAALAEQKRIEFTTHVNPEVPPTLTTDRKRVDQIIKNFLANAFKFTEKGSIRLEIDVAREGISGMVGKDETAPPALSVSVVDSGIGIPTDKHEMIFEAFQQVDGSTRRKYGGTGLGLSISRELARMLGGTIRLESREGAGSRFTLQLPIDTPDRDGVTMVCSAAATPAPKTQCLLAPDDGPAQTSDSGPDDDLTLVPGQRSILIIDDDAAVREWISEHAHQRDCKALVAERFLTGLHFADYYRPEAVFLNLNLHGRSGWAVLRRLKAHSKTRSTPVFVIATGGDGFSAILHGAAGHLQAPITTATLQAAFDRMADLRQSAHNRRVLVVAPAVEANTRLIAAIGDGPIRFIGAGDGACAADLLDHEPIHGVIVDPDIASTDGRRLFAGLQRHPVPVYIYPGHLNAPAVLEPFGQPGSPNHPDRIDTADRLLAALVGGLHLPSGVLTEDQQRRLQALDEREFALKGHRILLADDDMRTVFAVSSVLEDHGVEVLTGKSSKESLDKLDSFPDIDLILMDVMMAGVEDFRAIHEIRRREPYGRTPIIALTARAMAGDRARCLEAGADDYLSKPVNPDKLTSMLTIWLDPQLRDSASIG